MTNLHWSVNDIEEAEYEPLMEIMNANEDDRKYSSEEMMKQWMSLPDQERRRRWQKKKLLD